MSQSMQGERQQAEVRSNGCKSDSHMQRRARGTDQGREKVQRTEGLINRDAEGVNRGGGAPASTALSARA